MWLGMTGGSCHAEPHAARTHVRTHHFKRPFCDERYSSKLLVSPCRHRGRAKLSVLVGTTLAALDWLTFVPRISRDDGLEPEKGSM